MPSRIILIAVMILLGSLATTAANANGNGDEPKKEQYQYVNTSNAFGFSLLNLLTIQRIPEDTAVVKPAPTMISEEDKKFRESILGPAVF